ncbi:hypothetical protein D3C78_966490 [compost metagenome]
MVQGHLGQHLGAAGQGLALVAGRVAAAHVRVHAGVEVFLGAGAVAGGALRVVGARLAADGVEGEAAALLVGRHQVQAAAQEAFVVG